MTGAEEENERIWRAKVISLLTQIRDRLPETVLTMQDIARIALNEVEAAAVERQASRPTDNGSQLIPLHFGPSASTSSAPSSTGEE